MNPHAAEDTALIPSGTTVTATVKQHNTYIPVSVYATLQLCKI